jgi:hypothetical protein
LVKSAIADDRIENAPSRPATPDRPIADHTGVERLVSAGALPRWPVPEVKCKRGDITLRQVDRRGLVYAYRPGLTKGTISPRRQRAPARDHGAFAGSRACHRRRLSVAALGNRGLGRPITGSATSVESAGAEAVGAHYKHAASRVAGHA